MAKFASAEVRFGIAIYSRHNLGAIFKSSYPWGPMPIEYKAYAIGPDERIALRVDLVCEDSKVCQRTRASTG